MSKEINLGEFSPEQLKDAREEAHTKATEEKAKKRDTYLENKIKDYVKPLDQLKNNFTALRQKYADELSQGEIEKLAEAILEVAEKEEKEKPAIEAVAEAFNKKNLYRFMRERAALHKILDKSEKDLSQMIMVARKDSDLVESTKLWNEVGEWQDFNASIREILNKELPNQNPESFIAHNLLTLREYKKQLETGIVETPEVKKIKDEAIGKLLRNGLIAFTGETGTGKTKLAQKIAKELTGNYEFVLGHAMMTKEELLAYLGISAQTIRAEDVPRLIEEAKQKYENLNADQDPAQKKIALAHIEEVLKGQAKQKQLETKVVLGPLLKAAREGKIIIIDEFNYIDPGLLAACNALIEAKPGDKISMMGEEVEVKSGFGVIFTGNFSKTDIKRYGAGRKDLDPAFINRLNSGLIEYPTMPQEYDLVRIKAIIDQKDLKNGQEPPKRDLFSIGLAHLVDTKGNLQAAPDSLDQLWKLSQEFSILQKLYSGENLRGAIQSSAGTSFNLQKYHASMRTYGDIIEQWKKDAFRYHLEWYLYDSLIRPCSIVAPSESAQMFYILKNHGQFFQDTKWQDLQVDPRNWQLTGMEKIRDMAKKDFRQDVDLQYFSPQELSESLAGVKMPEYEIVTPQKKKVEYQKEVMDVYYELDNQIIEGKKFFEQKKDIIKLLCPKEWKDLCPFFGEPL